MRKNEMKTLLNVFVTLIFSLIFVSYLKAETPARESAQEMSLAQAEATPAVKSIPEYRKKEEQLVTEEEEELPWNVDAYYRYMPSSNADSQDGDVSLMRTEEDINYTYKAFGKLPIEFSIKNEYVGIENTTAVVLPAHLTGVGFGIETTFPFFNVDKTYWRVAVNPSFYSDDYTFDSSAFRIPVQTFLIHQPNEKLTLIAGVAINPDFDTEVGPILGVIYKANDRLLFNLVPRRPTIFYKLNDRLTIFAEGGFNSGEYEVTKGNLKTAVLKYNDYHAGLGLKYKINKNIEASVSGGGVFGRSLRYRDDNFGKVEIKGTGYSEFRLEMKI